MVSLIPVALARVWLKKRNVPIQAMVRQFAAYQNAAIYNKV